MYTTAGLCHNVDYAAKIQMLATRSQGSLGAGSQALALPALLCTRKNFLKNLNDTPSDGETEEARTQRRMRELPKVYTTQYERLACELALKLDDALVIFQRHGLNQEQAVALLDTKEFAALLDRVSREVAENGLSFRSKARAMAEELLPHAFYIATDELASSAVRADIIQWMARVGDLEPAKKDGKDAGTGGGLVLNIQFSGEAPRPLVTAEREPITIEAEK